MNICFYTYALRNICIASGVGRHTMDSKFSHVLYSYTNPLDIQLQTVEFKAPQKSVNDRCRWKICICRCHECCGRCWLVGWMVGWLVGWLVGGLVCCCCWWCCCWWCGCCGCGWLLGVLISKIYKHTKDVYTYIWNSNRMWNRFPFFQVAVIRRLSQYHFGHS